MEYITSPSELQKLLPLSERCYRSILRAAEIYPIKVTRYYLGLIDPDDPSDPIRRQVIPSPAELWVLPNEKSDPLGESGCMPCPGLVHRYRDRVLLLVSNRCAVHCRFCFRKDKLVRSGSNISDDELNQAMDYIEGKPGIREVILSGGEPFLLKNSELYRIIERLRQISHLESIRIHTRIPVVLPSRIDKSLIDVLRDDIPCWVVTHFNHPREITGPAKQAVSLFIDNGIPVLNQSVLLKGVNDDIDVLVKLCRQLITNRVKPYYIHMLDPARGVCHFKVPDEKAMTFQAEMQARLPGYAVPLFVRDNPKLPGKQVLK